MSEQANAAPAASPEASSSPAESAAAVESQSSENDIELLDGLDDSPSASAADEDEFELDLTVDGKVIKEKISLKDKAKFKEFMKNELQKSKAFNSKAAKAAEAEKRAAQAQNDMIELINYIKTNPKAVLADPNIGVDLRKFAEDIIAEHIEQAAKSPEQLRQEELEKENRLLKEAIEQEKAEKEAQEMARLETEVATKVQNDILSALKTGGLPESPKAISMVAQALKLANKYRVPVSAEEIIPVVKKQIFEEMKAAKAMLSEDDLEAMMGEETLKNMYKRYVSKAKAAKSTASVPSSESIKPTGQDVNIFNKNKKQERVNPKTWLKEIDKKY
jgi:hypothetical protein